MEARRIDGAVGPKGELRTVGSAGLRWGHADGGPATRVGSRKGPTRPSMAVMCAFSISCGGIHVECCHWKTPDSPSSDRGGSTGSEKAHYLHQSPSWA